METAIKETRKISTNSSGIKISPSKPQKVQKNQKQESKFYLVRETGTEKMVDAAILSEVDYRGFVEICIKSDDITLTGVKEVKYISGFDLIPRWQRIDYLMRPFLSSLSDIPEWEQNVDEGFCDEHEKAFFHTTGILDMIIEECIRLKDALEIDQRIVELDNLSRYKSQPES